MRKGLVLRNNVLAGSLTETEDKEYIFTYDDSYFVDPNSKPVSLTLLKTQKEYKSNYLFPYFYNMLSEGVNKKLQSRQLKIDEKDSFGLLLATAQYDTVGAISIKPV